MCYLIKLFINFSVLNQMLSRERGNVEARVNVALDKVCDVERYSISEYNSERMASVCDFMKRNSRSILYYSVNFYFL